MRFWIILRFEFLKLWLSLESFSSVKDVSFWGVDKSGLRSDDVFEEIEGPSERIHDCWQLGEIKIFILNVNYC